jgi:predicted small lipoprotein YifL
MTPAPDPAVRILPRRRALLLGLTLGLAGTLLASCGKKGDPLPPPDVPTTYPRQYPR